MLRLRKNSKIRVSLVLGIALLLALTGCSSCSEDSHDAANDPNAKETPDKLHEAPQSSGLRALPTDSNHPDLQVTRVVAPLHFNVDAAAAPAPASASAAPSHS